MTRKAQAELAWEVAREIAAEVALRTSKAEGLLSRTLITRPRVTSFTYSEGGGVAYSTTGETVEEDRLDFRRLADVQASIGTRDSFKRLQAELQRTFGTGPMDYELSPSTFVMNATAICGDLTRAGTTSAAELERGLTAYVTAYCARVAGAPAEASLTAWLEGVWLSADRLRVNDWLTLRRPTADDIQADLTRFWGIPGPFGLGRQGITAAAAEVSVVVSTPTSVSERIDLVCSALRLYRVCPCMAVRTDTRGEGYFPGGQQWSLASMVPGAKIPIGEGDVAGISALVEMLGESRVLGPKSGTEENPVKIAFARYSDGLLMAGLPEARITSAITSLEALFLGTDERTEIVHRLSQRLAVVFGLLGDPAVDVYEKVSRAYDIRSRFIHGSGLEGDARKSLDKLVARVMEFARVGLLIGIQALAKEAKDEFVARLDRAVLEPASREKLSERLNSFTTFRPPT